MATHTFTSEQLRQLLTEAINLYEQDIATRFIAPARNAAIDRVMAGLETPAIEPYLARYDWAGDMRSIPFQGEPVVIEDEDNISPAALGLEPKF